MSFRLFSPSGKFKKYRLKEFKNGKFIALNREHPEFESNAKIAHAVKSLELLDSMSSDFEKLVRIKDIQRELSVQSSEPKIENVEVVEDYLRKVITKRKTKVASKESARHYLYRAIKALGSESIRYSSIDRIQDALDLAYPNQKQRQLAMYLNCLLKHVGRFEKVEKNRLQIQTIRYLPASDIPKFLKAIDKIENREMPMDAFKAAVKVALFSGLRMGEILALDINSYNPRLNSIHVTKQIDTKSKLDLPKWSKQRTVAGFPELKTALPEWLKVKSLMTFQWRMRVARVVTQACKIAFPEEPQKHLTFHELRHSFAVRCLESGLSMEMLARQLGNTVRVCETYYIGFLHTDVTLSNVANLLSASKTSSSRLKRH